MRVIEADAMGFCFGVRDALEVAEAVSDPTEVTIHGQLVHNPAVMDRLEGRGFAVSSESNRTNLGQRPTVMITAHGISDRERERLVSENELIDTTCPLVRRAHRAARALENEGRHVIVIGRPGHVEVEGLIGDLDHATVVSSPHDVVAWSHRRLGIVCQTTTPDEEAADVLAAIEARNPHADIRFINTVCQPTRDRQRSAVTLARRSDVVVVVGGRNSNNTRRLAATCRAQGPTTHHIEGPDELDASLFDGEDTVGLTAGTSTPDDAIADVRLRLEEIARSLTRIDV